MNLNEKFRVDDCIDIENKDEELFLEKFVSSEIRNNINSHSGTSFDPLPSLAKGRLKELSENKYIEKN